MEGSGFKAFMIKIVLPPPHQPKKKKKKKKISEYQML